MTLLDTNVLVHSKQAGSPHYKTVTQRLVQFAEGDEELIVCPQVLYEFYVVATRPPAGNGLGISCEEAIQEVKNIQAAYSFIDDPVNLFHTWRQLVQQYRTQGKAANDTRLVAFMQAQGISQFYTLNAPHFTRYNNLISIV